MAVVDGNIEDNPAAYTETVPDNASNTENVVNTSAEAITLGDLLSGSSASGVGDGFIRDIYNEERQTPHNEMESIRDMLMRNAFANTAVDTVADLLLGKEQRIVSSDERTQEWFNEQWLPETNAYEAMSLAAQDFIAFGNFYVEKRSGVVSDLIKKFEVVAHPERVWKQISDGGRVTGYVLEVPRNLVTDESGYQSFKVGYGDFQQRTVFGQELPLDKIESGRMGQGDFRFYGRSPLASTLSDHKILKEIERSMAVFSRYKSVAKKIISAFDATGENPLTTSSFNQLDEDWRTINDFDNLLVNGKQFDVKDLDYSGNQVDFTSMIDYLKRKITSAVIPEYYLHGENTTHAVSNSQESTFMLRMKSWRNQFLEAWNNIVREVARQQGLNEDVEWELGAFNVETDQEKREKALKAYNAGTITVDEMREMIGLPPAEDEVIGQSYKWELQSEPAAGPLMQKLDELQSDTGR